MPAPASTAYPVVTPQHIANGIGKFIVDYVDIQVAVVVVIQETASETGPQQLGIFHKGRHVRKGAIPVVAVETILMGEKIYWLAVRQASPVDYIQIQPTIIVEVSPSC